MKKKGQIFKKLIGAVAVACAVTLMSGMSTEAAAKPAVKALEKITISASAMKSDTKLTTVSETRVYQIKVSKPSMIGFHGFSATGSGYGDLKVDIYNSKNKKLNGNAVRVNSVNDLAGYYHVKSGTYYLKVENVNPFAFYYGTATVKENSGAKKSKAKALKKGQTKVGIIAIGEAKGKVDYYKMTLKNPAKIKFQVASYSTTGGGIVAEFLPSSNVKNVKGSVPLKVSSSYRNHTFELASKAKLPKGTYYLKVYRRNKKSTNDAQYAISWKK